MSWTIKNVSYPDVLRSTNQQTAAALIWQPPAYTHKTISSTGVADQFLSQEGIALRRWELHNRSGGSAACGIGFRLQNRFWIAGQLNAAGTVFTDDTADAQSTTTNDFPLEIVAGNNGGFIIACAVPFDWFSVNVTTAGVDGAAATDHDVAYSNAAGTGWTALGANAAMTDGFTATNTVYATGAHEFVWAKPADWGAITSLLTLPIGWYAIRVRSTTAPDTTAALAKAIELGTMRWVEAVADNGIYQWQQMTWHEEKADGIVGYFSTANAGNTLYVECTSA